MSRLICKTSQYVGCYSVRYLVHNSNVSSLRIRWSSISSADNEKHSFTVSYLMNSLGFDQNKALSASKHVNLQTSEKPDKTIEFFEEQGLTRSQIASLVRMCPKVLLSNVEKFILPKLEFLRSKGISKPEMALILSSYPALTQYSLAKTIVPSYDFLRDMFGSDEKAISAVKRSPDILMNNLEKKLSPNIDTLRLHGVPVSDIYRLVASYPRIFSRCPIEVRKAVKNVVEMGFDASSCKFMHALVAICIGMRNSVWERRVEAYKKWGWTDEDVLMAFKSDPRCMSASLDRINATMEFYVAEIGLKSSQLAKSPYVFSHGLKKVKLRSSISRTLILKGLLKGNFCILALAPLSEKVFLKKYVTPYIKKAPELLDFYKVNASLSSTSESDEDRDR